jgi:hypothetical protein
LSKPGTITVKAGCARRPTGTGQRRPGARTREASLDRARARFKPAPVGRMARDRTLPLHLLHHEVTPADLAGVTASMRVMPAVDGYECLRQPVAAGDGTGGPAGEHRGRFRDLLFISPSRCPSRSWLRPPRASRRGSALRCRNHHLGVRAVSWFCGRHGGRAELFAGAGVITNYFLNLTDNYELAEPGGRGCPPLSAAVDCAVPRPGDRWRLLLTGGLRGTAPYSARPGRDRG